MDVIEVVVEVSLSQNPWYVEWVPIIIAICALIVSVLSLYWSRIQHRNSSRPFMWFMDFGITDQNQRIIMRPEMIAIRTTNAPALVKEARYDYYILSGDTKRIIHSQQETNFVRFPDTRSQNTYTVGDFRENIINCQPEDIVERFLRIEYSSLSKGKKYTYESLAKYDLTEQRWRYTYEKAT